MPPVPNYDLGILITLNICITLVVLLAVAFFGWLSLKQGNETARIAERVAGIAERLDARLRRQYADIDLELQHINEQLGGQ